MFKGRVILAAMAGITDGSFANEVAINGADGVTIGGFNCHTSTFEAAVRINERGREEFIITPQELAEHIPNEINKISVNLPVIINLRFSDPHSKWMKGLLESLRSLDKNIIIELNSHCRQPEITECGGGESLLKRLESLENGIRVGKQYEFPISVKIRSSSLKEPETFLKLLRRESVDYRFKGCLAGNALV